MNLNILFKQNDWYLFWNSACRSETGIYFTGITVSTLSRISAKCLTDKFASYFPLFRTITGGFRSISKSHYYSVVIIDYNLRKRKMRSKTIIESTSNPSSYSRPSENKRKEVRDQGELNEKVILTPRIRLLITIRRHAARKMQQPSAGLFNRSRPMADETRSKCRTTRGVLRRKRIRNSFRVVKVNLAVAVSNELKHLEEERSKHRKVTWVFPVRFLRFFFFASVFLHSPHVWRKASLLSSRTWPLRPDGNWDHETIAVVVFRGNITSVFQLIGFSKTGFSGGGGGG